MKKRLVTGLVILTAAILTALTGCSEADISKAAEKLTEAAGDIEAAGEDIEAAAEDIEEAADELWEDDEDIDEDEDEDFDEDEDEDFDEDEDEDFDDDEDDDLDEDDGDDARKDRLKEGGKTEKVRDKDQAFSPLGVDIVETNKRKDGSSYGVDKLGYYGMSKEAEEVSAKKTPKLKDFDWFLDGVMQKGVPDDAENIHHPEDAIGDWKCLVIYDPLNENGELAYHLGTLHMDCRQFDGKENLSPHIEWNYVLDENKENKTDESDKDFFLSYGPFTDGWYGEDGNGNMSFRMWTMGDGKQYALGAANLKDSSNNFVVLVRP